MERKIENERRNSYKIRRGLFFSLFETPEICFGSIKVGIFYREKAFFVGKKMRKNDFAPFEKFSTYALAMIHLFFLDDKLK